MQSFELRRAQLLHSSITNGRQWFPLNRKICGALSVAKFMSNSPLVANFPMEFALVPLESVKNGGSFDRRLILEGNRVAIASPFGVICAILRQKINEGEIGKYAWIVNALNSIQIDSETDEVQAASSAIDPAEELKAATDLIAIIRKENDQLKADLDRAQVRLKSLAEELNNVELLAPEAKVKPKMVDKEDAKKEDKVAKDVWTSINDVCDKFQVHLADVLADQVHSSDVGRILSDIASKVASKSSSPRQVIEAIMGDSAAQFLQSLRVPDWTLLYFKLQSRIPDQAWQTLVSLTKLGRTGVSHNLVFLELINKNRSDLDILLKEKVLNQFLLEGQLHNTFRVRFFVNSSEIGIKIYESMMHMSYLMQLFLFILSL